MPEQHDVVGDYCGWNDGHRRLTCRTCHVIGPTLVGSTLVSQPYMTRADWDTAKAKFLAAHPCAVVKEIP